MNFSDRRENENIEIFFHKSKAHFCEIEIYDLNHDFPRMDFYF